jgi:putative ABC transport system permease protein
MFRLTWKGLWAHKLRFALTGLAVVLGVAFLSGAQVLTDTMGATFDGIFENANQGVDVVVRGAAAIDVTLEEPVRERVDAHALGVVRDVPGVDVAEGSIQGQAVLVGPDGKAEAASAFGGVIGANWIDDGRLNPFTIAAGHAPTEADQAVIDRTAQELFAEPGAYDRILVASDGSTSAAALATRVETALGAPDTFEVLTGEADTADSKADLKQGLGFFSNFLLAFAYIALFVGMFIIYNTFSVVVAQRAKDMAMLRAIGASRGQVVRSVLLESLAVGVIASGAGLVAGIGLSFGLRALLEGVGLDVPTGPIVIEASTVVGAFAVGTFITVVSAVLPALRSSRVKPITALRDVAVDASASSVARTAAGVTVLGLGVVSFAAGSAGSGSPLALIGLGTMIAISGVFVLGPVLAGPAMLALGAGAEAASGTTGRLAKANATRNPKRTSATASALMIGVALVGLITILAASTKASIADTLSESLQADFVVTGGAFGAGGLSPEIAADLSAVPGVDLVVPARSTPVSVAGTTTEVAGIDTASLPSVADVGVTGGRLGDVSGGAVAVEDHKAKADGLSIGDTITMTFGRTGPVQLTVAAFIDRPPPGFDGIVYLVDLDTYEANVTDQFDRQLFVNVADGVRPAALEAALERWPNANLQDQAAFGDSVRGQIDIILNLVYGLLALAVVIALIGIANTLALSVHERRRELGLLRAVGMSRAQVRAAVRWEAVMIALMGTFLGFGLAIAGGWGVISAIEADRPIPFVVPPVQLTVIVVFAAVAGVVAAVGPGRRAARLDILTAIASN